jgi:hypothetical protein
MPAVVGYENDCLAIVHVQFLFTPSLTKKFEGRTTLSCDLGQSNVRDNDGRKLDHITLEALRLRAVAQTEGGAHPEDVAGRWTAPVDSVRVGGEAPGGREGRVKAKPVPDRPPQLPGPVGCAPCLRGSHIPHMRHLQPRQGRATGDWSG